MIEGKFITSSALAVLLIAGIIGFGVHPAVSQPVKSDSGSVELTVAQASSRLVAAREKLKTQTAWFQKNGGGSDDRISAKSLELKNNFLAGLQGDVTKAEQAYSDVLKATGTTASVNTPTVKMTLKQARKAESKTRYLARMARYKANRTARKALTSSKRVKGFTRWIAKKNVSPEKQKELANRQAIAKKAEADAALAAKVYNEAKAAAAGARANLDALNTYQASNSMPSATNPTPPASNPKPPVVNVSNGTVPGYEKYEGYKYHKNYWWGGGSQGMELSGIGVDAGSEPKGSADYTGHVTLKKNSNDFIAGKLNMGVDFTNKKISGSYSDFKKVLSTRDTNLGWGAPSQTGESIAGRIDFVNAKVSKSTVNTYSLRSKAYTGGSYEEKPKNSDATMMDGKWYKQGKKLVQKQSFSYNKLGLSGGLKGSLGKNKVTGSFDGQFVGGNSVMEATGSVSLKNAKTGAHLRSGIFNAKRKN